MIRWFPFWRSPMPRSATENFKGNPPSPAKKTVTSGELVKYSVDEVRYSRQITWIFKSMLLEIYGLWMTVILRQGLHWNPILVMKYLRLPETTPHMETFWKPQILMICSWLIHSPIGGLGFAKTFDPINDESGMNGEWLGLPRWSKCSDLQKPKFGLEKMTR